MALDQISDDQLEELAGGEAEMSFLDHLEELRWHLIRALMAIAVFMVTAFVMKDFFFGQIILGPSRTDFLTYKFLCDIGRLFSSEAFCMEKLPFIIQSRQMTGQFTMHITSSFVIGLVCAFPYVFWEVWRFIKPGLYPKEQRSARGATFWVSFLFLIGVSFGYFLLAPISVNFLGNYQIDPSILNEFDIISYVSTVTILVLASGILFQLPIVVFFLTKAGLIYPKLMKHYRKHAIVVILVLGAMITPPDPISQILIAVPLVGLYQVSISISNFVYKRNQKLLK